MLRQRRCRSVEIEVSGIIGCLDEHTYNIDERLRMRVKALAPVECEIDLGKHTG